MSAALTLFAYRAQQVRVVTIKGEPWFVASDIADALEYASAKDFARGVDDEDKGRHIVPTPSGDQEMTIISEGGLYTALVRARTDRAKPFRRWVTHEVLPQIRRTGAYSATPQLSDDEIVHQALQITARRVEQLEAELAVAQPKAATWDLIVSGTGSYTITEAAKVLCRSGAKTGPRILHDQLAEAGWVFKTPKGKWAAKQVRLNDGCLIERARWYVDEDGVSQLATPQVRVTAKGLHRLRELLTPQPALEVVP